MAIEKIGEAPGKEVIVCSRCHALLAFDKEDIKYNCSPREWWTYIYCPKCNNYLIFEQGEHDD